MGSGMKKGKENRCLGLSSFPVGPQRPPFLASLAPLFLLRVCADLARRQDVPRCNGHTLYTDTAQRHNKVIDIPDVRTSEIAMGMMSLSKSRCKMLHAP